MCYSLTQTLRTTFVVALFVSLCALSLPVAASELYNIQASDAPIGNPDAPVTIIEYASLSCPHCARFHGDILPELKTKYIDTGKVSLTLRHFPLNEPALKAAMITQCVRPEQYNKYSSVFFELQKDWAFTTRFLDNIRTIATVGGMSPDQVQACLSNLDLEKEILLSRKQAAEELTVKSTPSFFINGTLYQGPGTVEGFEEAIETALATIGGPAEPAAE